MRRWPRATATRPTTCWRSPARAPRLAAPIVAGHPDLLAEAPFSASREQALSVGDVLLRRTRLGLVAARAIRESGGEAPVRVARAMGAELGWDEPRVALEARRFDEEARAEYVPGDE